MLAGILAVIATACAPSPALDESEATVDPATGPGAPVRYAVIATVAAGSQPFGVTVDSTLRRVFVADDAVDSSRTIMTFDADTGARISSSSARIEGDTVLDITVDPLTHTLYLPHYPEKTGGGITVINADKGAIAAEIPVGSAPYATDTDPGEHLLYVANHSDDTVSVIDELSNTVSTVLPAGESPMDIAVDPATHTVYCVNQVGTVTVIDGITHSVRKTIPVGHNASSIAVASDTRTIFVSNHDDNTVSVIDGAKNVVTATFSTAGRPGRLAVDPGRHVLYMASSNTSVSVVDTATYAILATVPVGQYPSSIAVDPTKHHAYVTSNKTNTLSVIGPQSP
ncbi:YncE family protein [Amycolatopsis sp. NPDC048633]|uniref:YncE family protein n=1 Tax=Amycolatopsis sp. NPDC048633 TaxID=3157095 RepID=UPI0033D6C468